MIGLIGALLIAVVVTMYCTPIAIKWATKTGAIDHANERRVNTVPIPRAGGIAIFAGFVVAIILVLTLRQWRHPEAHVWTTDVTAFLVALFYIAGMGLIDDRKNLSPKWQVIAMAGAALILALCGVRIEGIAYPFMGGQPKLPLQNWLSLNIAFSVLLTVIWVLVVTKTVDAIDGVDGLASGVVAIAATTLGLMAAQLNNEDGPTLTVMSAALVGSCLGFLRYNYHPAKIFMGTVGAYTLGFSLAAISIIGAFKVAAAVSVLVPLLALAVPILDFTHVVARRAIEGASLTAADKRHLHHRLLARGWSQPKVVWFIYSITLIFCATAFAIFRTGR